MWPGPLANSWSRFTNFEKRASKRSFLSSRGNGCFSTRVVQFLHYTPCQWSKLADCQATDRCCCCCCCCHFPRIQHQTAASEIETSLDGDDAPAAAPKNRRSNPFCSKTIPTEMMPLLCNCGARQLQ